MGITKSARRRRVQCTAAVNIRHHGNAAGPPAFAAPVEAAAVIAAVEAETEAEIHMVDALEVGDDVDSLVPEAEIPPSQAVAGEQQPAHQNKGVAQPAKRARKILLSCMPAAQQQQGTAAPPAANAEPVDETACAAGDTMQQQQFQWLMSACAASTGAASPTSVLASSAIAGNNCSGSTKDTIEGSIHTTSGSRVSLACGMRGRNLQPQCVSDQQRASVHAKHQRLQAEADRQHYETLQASAAHAAALPSGHQPANAAYWQQSSLLLMLQSHQDFNSSGMQVAGSNLGQQAMAFPDASSFLPQHAISQQQHRLPESSSGPSAAGFNWLDGSSGPGSELAVGHTSAKRYNDAWPWRAAAPIAGALASAAAAAAAAQHMQQRRLQQATVLDLSLPDEVAYHSSERLPPAAKSGKRPAAPTADNCGSQQLQHAILEAAGLSSRNHMSLKGSACTDIPQAAAAAATCLDQSHAGLLSAPLAVFDTQLQGHILQCAASSSTATMSCLAPDVLHAACAVGAGAAGTGTAAEGVLVPSNSFQSLEQQPGQQLQQQQLKQMASSVLGASDLSGSCLSGSVEGAVSPLNQPRVHDNDEQSHVLHMSAAEVAPSTSFNKLQDTTTAAAVGVVPGSAAGFDNAVCQLSRPAEATKGSISRTTSDQEAQSQEPVVDETDAAAGLAAAAAATSAAACSRDSLLCDTATATAAADCGLPDQQTQLKQQQSWGCDCALGADHAHYCVQQQLPDSCQDKRQLEFAAPHAATAAAAAEPAEAAAACGQDSLCFSTTQWQDQEQHSSESAIHKPPLDQLQRQCEQEAPQQQREVVEQMLEQQQRRLQQVFTNSESEAHPTCHPRQQQQQQQQEIEQCSGQEVQQCSGQCDPAVPEEVFHLLRALCVLLRLRDGGQLVGVLKEVSRLPELPACDNRGMCKACAHHEPLVAYVVGGLNQPTFNIYCSNCYHLTNNNSDPQQQQQIDALSCVPAIRHKGCAGMKALRDDSLRMRLLPDGAMKALTLLAEQFGSQLQVPDFSCCSQAKPHLLTTPEISEPAGQQQQQQQEPHRIGLMGDSNLSISYSELLGMLAGLIHCHLQGPVGSVGGDKGADTTEGLARSMLSQVMHEGQYAHCNPVTERLNQAQRVIEDHLAEHSQGQSPAETAVAALEAAQHMVSAETAEKDQQQATAAAAAVAAAPATTKRQQQKAGRGRRVVAGRQAADSSTQSKGSGRTRAAVATAQTADVNSQQQQKEQQQQVEDSIPPTPSAVHMLNIFILTVMFSKAVNGHYWNRGQVLNYILLLMGCRGTQTPGHIDPAAALTFAWPWLQPGEVWSEQLRDVPLATWLFLSPCVEAWQRLLEWLTLRQQPHSKAGTKQQQQKQRRRRPKKASPTSVTDNAVRSALEGIELQPDEIEHLVRYVGEEHTVVLQQCAGQAVCVEPGWKHWVFNRRPCFKVAFELMRPDQACAVVHMQQQLRGKMKCGQDDYMRTGCVVVERLVEWARWCSRKTKQQQNQ